MFKTLPTAFMVLAAGLSIGADWPQWGRDATRNAVSPEKGAPVSFQFTGEGKGALGAGVIWEARLGTMTIIPPVVADGLVWIGTNAREPAGPFLANEWDGGVLMCLRESDGKVLWQHRSPRRRGKDKDGQWFFDFGRSALGSAPLVEGERLWYVNNRNEVVCFDIGPLRRGTGTPTVVWKLDLREQLDVFPRLPIMQSGFAASVAGYKDKLYAVTHNAADAYNGPGVPKPDAPSLVCLDKATGKVLWSDNSPGRNIIDCQISSPLVAEINGRAQVIVGQGDGWLRSFDGVTGRRLWQCDLNAKDAVYQYQGGTRNYPVATPVLYRGRVYIATGRQVEEEGGFGCLYCIDPGREGDVSAELEAGPKKGRPNPNSAVVWRTPATMPVELRNALQLPAGRRHYFGRTVASCTVHDGLVYAVEFDGLLFCFDADNGKTYWIEDLRARLRGQPLWLDGHVYVVADDIYIFAHGRAKRPVATIDSTQAMRTGLVFANGTLYVTTDATLYAIRKPK